MLSIPGMDVAASCGKARYLILPTSCLGYDDHFWGPKEVDDEGATKVFYVLNT